MNSKFKMNDILKDVVSGYEGHCLGITFYATGCIHYGLAPLKLKDDGTVIEWQWFDESRLEFVKEGKRPEEYKPHSGPDMNVSCY